MVRYELNIDHPSSQYLKITSTFPSESDEFILRIPAWRPGRYELGNFAKNIKGLKVFDERNQRLYAQKISGNSWRILTDSTSIIRVEYSYYSSELNAGSTFLSKDQLYVNPVNCFVYSHETFEDPIELRLNIPENWIVACSLTNEGNALIASNFDELADSPFICSASLLHDQYEVRGTVFHIWFNGIIKPNWEILKKDFLAFTSKQIEKFIEFPTNEYHFLIQILPYKAYHGVEHSRSTVITLGPSYEVFGSLYKELLGVSSHELYHTWNVKAIRPIEMFPYDFTKENYSRMGYLCEGITTYMGDLYLLKSGVFKLESYLDEMKTQLQKHFDNHGRFNYSVADSSFDTWLDGYIPGAPGRKVSIYTEGCLLAFVKDVLILRSTGLKYGLDEVMKRLYFDFALKGKGVSEEDYKSVLENISGISFDSFFNDFINGTSPYEGVLMESFEFLGLEMKHVPSRSYSQSRLGFKSVQSVNSFLVNSLYPGGPADLAGIMSGDEIIAVNGVMCNGDLDKWLTFFDDDQKKLSIVRSGRLLDFILPEVNRNFYSEYSVSILENPNASQKKALQAWMS